MDGLLLSNGTFRRKFPDSFDIMSAVNKHDCMILLEHRSILSGIHEPEYDHVILKDFDPTHILK